MQIGSTIEMPVFAAARLQTLSADDREEELRRMGIKFMQANNLMRRDGSDSAFAIEFARRLYDNAIAKLERALRQPRFAA